MLENKPYLEINNSAPNQVSRLAIEVAEQKSAHMRTQTAQEYRESQELLAEVRQLPWTLIYKRTEVANVPCEWIFHRFRKKERRVIIYLHGGSWMFGGLESARPVGAMLCEHTKCRVLVVDYRLAPEHRYPAGFNDCYSVYNQLLADGYSADKIALFGDSAGGNYSLALLNRLKAEGLPLPKCVGLASPATDLRDESHLYSQGEDLIYTMYEGKETNIFYTYLGDEYYSKRDLPTISPITGDLSGLPPMLIHAGKAEAIAADNVAYADKLYNAGGTVNVKLWRDMFHDFSIVGKTLKESRESMEEMGYFFLSHLGVK